MLGSGQFMKIDYQACRRFPVRRCVVTPRRLARQTKVNRAGQWLAFRLVAVSWAGFGGPSAWPPVELSAPQQVELAGPVGAQFQRGVERLGQPPYAVDWLLADVAFKVSRIFTNYSGDVSGRFIELATLTSPPERYAPAALRPVLDQITRYQKSDGHFGLEMNFAEPMRKLSPPIPMLWGNARLLAGLVTAAVEYHDPKLLAATRRLGDFYVATTNVFCSPVREAEMRAMGTDGEGYTCCYFPAIEGLTMLYRATHEARYLEQARRMAEWFRRFDALPVDHSHGNLCAWRGILELYDLTGEASYLDRAVAKWTAAVQGGYVWSLGGIGEHWYRSHQGDEGCSESDWLRFNLQLWRFTGQTRFLDLAERLLHNQYSANQCPNGGYGWRSFDGEPSGPIGTQGDVSEWNFCCSFHGPLGLHFLKACLAAGSKRGVFVNFPLDFAATVNADGRAWRVAVRTGAAQPPGQREFDVEVAPAKSARSARTTLWVRRPDWAAGVKLTTAAGAPVPFVEEGGYLRLKRAFKAGERLHVVFQTALRVERRRFEPVAIAPGGISRLREVALLDGPEVLFAAPAPSAGRMILLAPTDANGRLAFWPAPQGGRVTVALPGIDASPAQIEAALASAKPISLRPEPELQTRRRTVFTHDLVVVPVAALAPDAVARFTARAAQAQPALTGPFFGEHLELNPEFWLRAPGWHFGSNSLHVAGGDIGLLDGQSYADYRFEFDLELPPAGEGMAGWVVRARGPGDCLMFQIQSADSPYRAPEWKTRPNTLRPHVRRGGEWTLAEPVPLPKEVRRGETHHITVECRGTKVTVLLDGETVCEQDDAGLHSGTVGFRAVGPSEQGRFRSIALSRF